MRDRGTDAAFAALIDRHAGVVRSAIRKVLGARHAALREDVEQELRLALWKVVRGGKTIEHPVSYLYKAAMTTAWAVVKREPPAEATMQAAEASFGDGRAEARLRLDEMLSHLPAEQARALRAYLAGFNHTEIAVLYGWTPSVARHRIYRGLEVLRRDFAADGKR